MFDYASLVREYKCPVKLYWKASWSQDVRHLLISILLFGKEIRLICCNLFLTSHLPSSSLIKQIPALDHYYSTDFERRTYFLDVQQPLSCLSLHIWCLPGTDTWVYSVSAASWLLDMGAERNCAAPGDCRLHRYYSDLCACRSEAKESLETLA